MAFVKDVLVEEYIRLSEKLEFYLIKNQDGYLKTIVEIKKDMDFIEKAFVTNNVDLAQEVVLMQRNREEVKKASQDSRFMQDCKDIMEHFSQADEEVFAKPGTDRRDSRESTLDERTNRKPPGGESLR